MTKRTHCNTRILHFLLFLFLDFLEFRDFAFRFFSTFFFLGTFLPFFLLFCFLEKPKLDPSTSESKSMLLAVEFVEEKEVLSEIIGSSSSESESMLLVVFMEELEDLSEQMGKSSSESNPEESESVAMKYVAYSDGVMFLAIGARLVSTCSNNLQT